MSFAIHVYELQVSSTLQIYRYKGILMLDNCNKIGLMNRFQGYNCAFFHYISCMSMKIS